MSNFFAEYPVNSGGGGGGVTSLNGQTGALTLIAGTNITITPGAGTLTIAATGSSGANTALSNLASVAINTSLLPGVDNSIDVGSASKTFANGFIRSLRSSTFSGVESISPENFALNDGNGAAWPSLSFGNEELLVMPKNPGLPRTLKWTDETGLLGVGFKSPSGLTQDYIYTFPSNYGTSGFSLQTDGLGGLSWGASSSSSGIAGSVQFSDGSSGFDSDATDFFWDNTNKTLRLGNPPISSSNEITLSTNRDVTDPPSDFNVDHISNVSLHLTTNTSTAMYNSYAANKVLIDTGVSVGGGNINYSGFIDRTDPADLGTSGALAGSYNYIAQSDGAKVSPFYASYLGGGNSVSDGTISSMWDFYAMSSSLAAGTVTNRYGIVIEPDSGYTKSNWLSGVTQMGGSSVSPAPSTILDLQSTTGALLVPRMSTADKTALTAAEGMIVYDTDLVELEGYMGGSWTPLNGGGGSSDVVELRTITAPEAAAKQIVLAATPTTANYTRLSIAGAPDQFYGDDFVVTGNVLSWSGLGLDGILDTGDRLTIEYN